MIENYQEYKQMIDDSLLYFLPKVDEKSEVLREAMEYSLTAGGKRLRPVLLLSACEFAGTNCKEALPFACAMEYIQTYSLIHDDHPSMDNDDLRRGKPTNHKVFGDGMAILAGDGLLNSAYEVMTKDMFLHLDQPDKLKRRIKAMYAIAKAAGVDGMISGQAADIDNENKMCSKEMVEYIHLNKTAALIVSAIRAGLHIGGADDEMLKSMTIYAENLGLAYQILDDILDVEGSSEEMGKATGGDEKNHKATFVSCYGLEASYKRLNQLTENAIAAIEDYYDNAEFFKNLVISLSKRNK